MNDIIIRIVANPKARKRLAELLLNDKKKTATVQLDGIKKYKITRKGALEISNAEQVAR